MSFSFTEPSTTHPIAEDNPVETKEVSTDATTNDVHADTSTNVQDDNASTQSAEDTRGETSGQPSEARDNDGENGESKPDDTTTDTEEVQYFFGDYEVTVDIPQDVTDSLKEKGIDAKQVAKELYAKDGKFELSDATKQKLYDAFGKFAVDAYLSGLKAQNEAFFLKEANAAKELEAANTQRFSDVSKEIGGEEGWSRLEAWALEALSDDELMAFNAVMGSGNQYLQQYAVRELESRRKAAQGDDKPSLIEPSAPAAASEDNGPLSREQYLREMMTLSSRFGTDKKAAAEYQARLDARRRAGMARGL
ncbi:head scaffolding protein [Escherichia phage vB_EcoP_K]|uniref:Putative scaffolding protein n=3 Tax=Vectrevirus TaxID=2732928 RepID=A0A1Q1PV69_9CAUD|nr:head scaffolding protein [Escherichia phage vB_EcoP_C]YP_009789164.1 head scaffolding protein [Escherichia phage vB_EcoP_K]AQN31669.1 putative scaffolding protein [Escherichia phage vB_EcoP_C]AQN31937.1 putative scaffolding protein [Escherichia phage vB_EcoP_K]AQN32002.1 putative scaffolding protein [Escherichia phage vB_EcoP_R]